MWNYNRYKDVHSFKRKNRGYSLTTRELNSLRSWLWGTNKLEKLFSNLKKKQNCRAMRTKEKD